MPSGATTSAVTPVVPASIARTLMAANVSPMRIGVLTGGGDCPGVNAVIRGPVRTGVPQDGYDFLGFRHRGRGPLVGDALGLDSQTDRGVLPPPGYILCPPPTQPLAARAGA